MSRTFVGLLILLMLAAARLSAGPVEYSARLLSAPGLGQASGPDLNAPGLDFDRNGFFRAGSMDPATGLFLTPMFFRLPFWGNGFHVFDFGDTGWGWGWGYNDSGYLPQVTCFGGFCRTAEPPVARFLPAMGSAPEPLSGGVAAGALPAVSLTPSATPDTNPAGPLAPADQPVGNPEPGTLMLLAAGLAAIFFVRRKN